MQLKNFFKDKKGRVVVGQWPNWPLWLAIFFFILGFIPVVELRTISFWGLTISLTYWSYLEIFFGVNSWRRILGILVLGSQIYKIASLL